MEEDLPRAQEGSHLPDVVISGLLEKLSVKVAVLSSWAFYL